MSKSNRIYKIFMATMIVAIAGMLLAMGIIAAQKTMKLGVRFPSKPNYRLEVLIQKTGSTAEPVFCNFKDDGLGKQVEMKNGISSLDGNTIVADSSFFTKYENDFTIIIKNYTESTGIEVAMESTAKIDGGADGIPAQIQEIKDKASKYDPNTEIADSVSFRIYVNSVFPQTTTLKMIISEMRENTITFNWNNDVDGLEVKYQEATPPSTMTYIPGEAKVLNDNDITKEGCEFLGWTYGEETEPQNNLDLGTLSGDLTLTANWGATLFESNYAGTGGSTPLFKILWNNFKDSSMPEVYTNNLSFDGAVIFGFEDDMPNPYYDSLLTAIIFGSWEDYAGKFNYNYTSGIENLDEQGEGSIKLFKYGTEAYILSPNKIFANQNSGGLLMGEHTEVGGIGLLYYTHSSLTSIKLENFDTSKVINMEFMFYGCSRLTSLNVSNFDTSKVTSMSSMFSLCSSLTSLDLSSFDTSKVTNMYGMFYNCSNLTSLDLSNFNTSKVTSMSSMFYGCSSLANLTLGNNFDTSNVTAMYYMFYNCTRLTSLDLSNFNTSNVTNMQAMFFGCSSLETIYVGSGWSTTKVTSSGNMFNGCTTKLKGAISWNSSNATDKTYANYETGYLTLKN